MTLPLNHFKDRVTLIGQALYEADVAKCPVYHDGTPRKRWNQLGELEQWSWNRPIVEEDFNTQSTDSGG